MKQTDPNLPSTYLEEKKGNNWIIIGKVWIKSLFFFKIRQVGIIKWWLFSYINKMQIKDVTSCDSLQVVKVTNS